VRECEADGQCPGSQVCREFTCQEPPCTANSCGAGLICSNAGRCIMDIGAPPSGPPPSCTDTVRWECVGTESHCGQILSFEPKVGDGWDDYPINGETAANQYRSFARRDLMMLVQYAAAQTRCLSAGFTVGNGGNLGLGDMSEQNGAIPGASIGQPGHPEGTHVNGRDMDIAYYQVNTPNNRLRSVCEHVQGGRDAYRCVAEPHLLDVWRSALFIAKLHDSPQTRVVGVDGYVGPLMESAITQLCRAGWLSGRPCTNLRLAYEVTNEGRGWYNFHHHHLHVSLMSRAQAGLSFPAIDAGALAPGRPDLTIDGVDPRQRLYRLAPLSPTKLRGDGHLHHDHDHDHGHDH
jgi:hypothetical protein